MLPFVKKLYLSTAFSSVSLKSKTSSFLLTTPVFTFLEYVFIFNQKIGAFLWIKICGFLSVGHDE